MLKVWEVVEKRNSEGMRWIQVQARDAGSRSARALTFRYTSILYICGRNTDRCWNKS